MKALSTSFILLCVILCGCSTVTTRKTGGRDFDETKLKQIQKGVTTAVEVVRLYGEPNTKEIISANQVVWHYTYLNELSVNHETGLLSGVEQNRGFKKHLDILFQDDTVINFSYSEVPLQSEKSY